MDSNPGDKKTLGAVLIENFIITKEEFEKALNIAKDEQKTLAEVLVEKEIVSEDDLVYLMINCFSKEHTPLDDIEVNMEVVERIPEKISRKIFCFPFAVKDNVLQVAMLDPISSERILKNLEGQLGVTINSTVSMKSEIERAFQKYYDKATLTQSTVLETDIIESEDELLSELGQALGIPQKKPEISGNLIVEEIEPGEIAFKQTATETRMRERPRELAEIEIGSAVNPGETFDNFVSGKQNKFAFNLALNIAKAFNPSYNPFFIYSESGLGKTHLLNAIANYIDQKGMNRRYIYYSITDFEDEFSKTLLESKTVQFKEACKRADMFLMDDIQLLGNKQDLQGEIFSIFNYYIQQRKQLVITSDVSPLELTWMDERLQSRLMSGVIVNVQSYDDDTKKEIIKKEALIVKVSMPDDVLDYLVENSEQNIRKLKGAFKMLAAMNKLESKEITLDEAKNVVKMLFPQKKTASKTKK
ncbi:MAG: ATP-binding protein [Acidobacteria bacterium]|nr:ATP-binding protein [Acidobacteriota bacterium]